MATTDSSRSALEARVRQHVVRFLDVKPDWRPFTKYPKPGNDRAIYQYLGQNGHGEMDPWALPSSSIRLPTRDENHNATVTRHDAVQQSETDFS